VEYTSIILIDIQYGEIRTMNSAMRIFGILSVSCLTFGLLGCANEASKPALVSSSSQANAAAPAPTASTNSASALETKAPVVLPAPGSPFSKLKVGMSRQQVEQLIGFPDHTTSHITGKQFIPFYFGGDTRRTEAFYKGQGVLTYDNNSRFGSTDSLIKITVDTNTP
jgi:hypothetical protein